MTMLGSLTRSMAVKWADHRIKGLGRSSPLFTLKELMTKAQNTHYGKQYGFGEMLQFADFYERFRDRLPIIDYADWVQWLGDKSPLGENGAMPLDNQAWPGIVDIFCLSSGTTSGRTKYVPYSKEMAAINRRAALDFFSYALRHQPKLSPPGGRALYMSGSTHMERNEYGALCGDMSGLTKFLAPKLLEMVTLPPRSISSLEPWSKRLDALVELCISRNDITMISGIPIWQLTLLETIWERTEKPISQTMPNLRCLIHGGMSMDPYRDRIADLVGPDVFMLESYAASETGIAAYQVPGEKGMRFCEDYGVFYEFEAPNGDILLGAELKPNIPYGLIVSSCSGLWRYRIGDRLVFKSTKPLILDHVTRDNTTSAFDEKVTEKEIERAMASTTPAFSDFSLGPDIQARRHHWFIVGEDPAKKSWVTELDGFLRKKNQDYDDYRTDGRIKAPVATFVPDRAQFLEAIGREEGGQRKFPRLLSPSEVEDLKKAFPGEVC